LISNIESPASGYSSHEEQSRGSKHVMFGAIVLEPEKKGEGKADIRVFDAAD
jgi:hypothetical protein